ncbi:hypothetical protein BOTBODRAFT_173164 [Botryobasidium botryosum FD-172 SS1]|uniref:Uncharacterized protein n=1 Tax=Botryobasidium botryosum (strain FD-172 SS1) TaxID=930990 RepID=A0A067MNG2_BOTB1|nr:hypothetical protein BOTBODRAFT_173164 [Botryobasidium botryosum FD-172 SS1]
MSPASAPTNNLAFSASANRQEYILESPTQDSASPQPSQQGSSTDPADYQSLSSGQSSLRSENSQFRYRYNTPEVPEPEQLYTQEAQRLRLDLHRRETLEDVEAILATLQLRIPIVPGIAVAYLHQLRINP